MVAGDLVEMLKDANPEAPVFLDYCGFTFNVDSGKSETE